MLSIAHMARCLRVTSPKWFQENKDKLTAVLLYHVVAGKVTSDKVVDLTSAETLQGESVGIEVKMGKVYVDGAQVVAADVMASNGVIHVIDTVILPGM